MHRTVLCRLHFLRFSTEKRSRSKHSYTDSVRSKKMLALHLPIEICLHIWRSSVPWNKQLRVMAGSTCRHPASFTNCSLRKRRRPRGPCFPAPPTRSTAANQHATCNTSCPIAKQLDDRMSEEPLPSSLTEAHHVWRPINM